MAELRFIYGSMNSGKSLYLAAKAFNLSERHICHIIIKPTTDTRDSAAFISSRALVDKTPCIPIAPDDSLIDLFYDHHSDSKYILVDEAQFLTSLQVEQLVAICDLSDVDVFCYGLRTDFKTNLFPGSKRLFELADVVEQMTTICPCGKHALINARFDEYGYIIDEGSQIDCGAEEKYISLCRSCYRELMVKKKSVFELLGK